MAQISVYARRLQIFCVALVIPTIVLLYVLKWFQDLEGSDHNMFAQMGYTWDVPGSFAAIPLLHQLAIIFFDCASLALIVWGLVCCVRVLGYYRTGQAFCLQTTVLFKRMAQIALAYAVYAPIKETLITLAGTLSNPPGMRVLSVTLGSSDVMHIFIAGVLFLVASLMHEACVLKSEQDLTV